MSPPSATALPPGARRLIVLTVYSRDGRADPVLLRAAEGLRDHAAELVVVVNGEMDASGLTLLGAIADLVTVRENAGFDVAAQRDALRAVGERIDLFDEVLLANDTWYGPMTDFSALFARMDATPADFWGLTAHAAVDWIPWHVQSYWFAARRAVTRSEVWASYWRDQPTYATYWDAVIGHELALTGRLRDAGFHPGVAFPEQAYPAGNATIVSAAALLGDGCPILKKRVFFFDPPELARRGGDAGAAATAAVAAGYPADLLWRHLLRTVAPATLAASCGLVDVDVDAGAAAAPADARVLAVVHADDAEALAALTRDLGDRVAGWDVVVTGTSAESAHLPAAASVRRVPSGRGAARALLDVVAGVAVDDGDVVVVLRAGGPDATEHRHAVRSLLGGGAVARLLDDPAVGLALPTAASGAAVDPPPSAAQVAALDAVRTAAGIRVPLDPGAPLRARAAMWVARPSVLARLVTASESLDGLDAVDADYVLGAVLASAAAEIGLQTRSITSVRDAARSLALGAVPSPTESPPPAEEPAPPADPPVSVVGRLARRLRR